MAKNIKTSNILELAVEIPNRVYLFIEKKTI